MRTHLRRFILGAAAGLLLSTALAVPTRAETLGPVTDDVGVVKIPKGQPILIGGLMVLSGPDLSLGTDASRGAEIAFDDRKNTLLGHPIKYLPEDGGCSVEGGQTGATRLAANKQILAVVGTVCSSESRGGAPILGPTLGESVSEATVGKWLKQAGDAVSADEPLVELDLLR